TRVISLAWALISSRVIGVSRCNWVSRASPLAVVSSAPSATGPSATAGPPAEAGLVPADDCGPADQVGIRPRAVARRPAGEGGVHARVGDRLGDGGVPHRHRTSVLRNPAVCSEVVRLTGCAS